MCCSPQVDWVATLTLKFVGNRNAKYEIKFQYGLVTGYLNPLGIFNKLHKMYDQLLNANKVRKKTSYLRSSLYTIESNEG